MNVDISERVVFQNETGGVSVVAPFIEQGYTIADAIRAVPKGRPYKVVNASDVPADRSNRMAWNVDATELTDGVGE